MSSTNYDVELNISYSETYRHYIPTYHAKVPYWHIDSSEWTYYSYYISFDEESETEMGYHGYRSAIDWNDGNVNEYNAGISQQGSNKLIPYSGVFQKAYIRNKRRDKVNFTPSNCFVEPLYRVKAAFEIIWNSTGFAANQNAWFKCSTVQKTTYKQYEWTAATVYYKKSDDSTYQSVAGTVSGSWSDVRIDTNVNFQDGYTYDVYIVATADDGTTATTPVAQFTTTDAPAIASCIAPAGAFTQGEATFIWSHSTEYGTPQYAYDLQYSLNNGSSWITVDSHRITPNMTRTVSLNDAGVYKWRVRTYNSNDVPGEWAEASFVNNVPANPPTNLSVDTKGRPTVSWAATSQTAYQVQFLLGDTVAYDSGAVYSTQNSHFVNQYFDDDRSYTVKLRIYNALGEVSEWVSTGYQQVTVDNVGFTVRANDDGGATIELLPPNGEPFSKYYLLRNNVLIAEIKDNQYTDKYAVGLTQYSVVGVTSEDQSDIKQQGIRVTYPQATIITLDGNTLSVHRRMNNAFEIQTANEASINKAEYLGDPKPTHYPGKMRLKQFTIMCFDDQGICEDLLGNVVFYADNFGNGGYCVVKNYSKTDSFIKTMRGVYGNEVSLTLEVTNYDDSIEYPI